MNKEHTGSRILKAEDDKSCHLVSTGVRFMINGNDSSSRFSLVEHPMEPRALAAPLHRHRNEDEYGFVIEGRIGADLGGEIVFGDRGRPDLQATQSVAYLLECGRRACAHLGNHLAGRV